MSVLFKIILTAFLIATPPYFVFAFLYEYYAAKWWIQKIAEAIIWIWCCLLALVICGGLYFIIQWIWTL